MNSQGYAHQKIETIETIETIEWQVDDCQLKGALHCPDQPSYPLVIGSHGLLADKESPKQKALARACIQIGIGFLRLDHRGCGQSTGRLETDTSIAARERDIISALEEVRSRYPIQSVGLFGSSFGGAVCLSVFSKIKAQAIVTFAAPFGHAPLHHLAVNPHKEWWFHLAFDVRPHLEDIHHALLMHGSHDKTIPVDHAYLIHDRVAHPKSLRIQQGGDHRMDSPAHQEHFIRLSSDWFKKFLPRA